MPRSFRNREKGLRMGLLSLNLKTWSSFLKGLRSLAFKVTEDEVGIIGMMGE